MANNKKKPGAPLKQERAKQTYKYQECKSIIYGLEDEFWFSKDEYYLLYSFYVTYSLCGRQSLKKRKIEDYGWGTASEAKSYAKSGLKAALQNVVNLMDNSQFIFTEENDLKDQFEALNLKDGIPDDISTERCVVARTSETNPYYKLFYRIRDGLAHGCFTLQYGKNRERMFIMQDHDSNNVTARIILKVSTLIDMAKTVNKNNLIDIRLKEPSGV